MTGSDGNIWFTDLIGNSIWRLELPTRALSSFPVPTPDSFPSDITLGADGNLWFVEGVAARLAGSLRRVSSQNLAATEFAVFDRHRPRWQCLVHATV